MSTKNSEDAAEPAAFGMRRKWLLTGGVLWVIALTGGLVIWSQSPESTTRQLMRTEIRPAETAAVDDADEPPTPVVLTLPVGGNSTNNSQVIDISELMGQAKPVSNAATWDPAGIEDFAFTNFDGRTITKADPLGRPWAICFVFTKCLGPCPTVTKQFRDLQSRLREEDIRLVTLTVDPVRDTPEVLASYAKLNGADPEKWHFLTGDQAEIYGLIHRSFRMPVQEIVGPDRQEGFEVIHSTNVMLVDAEGVVRGKFNAAKDAEMAQLRRELASLAVSNVAETPAVTDTPVADGRP